MDAKLRLAISVRLNQIFGTTPEAEKFLSFPREAPFVFNPAELSLLLKENESADQMASSIATMSNLSRMMNFPVRGMFYDNHNTDEVLWDVYGEVLKTAEVALSRNESDIADLEKANAALYVTDEFGCDVPTERYAKYNELRDRRFAAEQTRASIIAAGGDKEGLAEADKELEDIKREMAAGDLEKEMLAMEIIRDRVTVNNPASVWNELKHKYNPDIQFNTNLELIDYAPTYIFPSDILQQDWDSIHLSSEDVDRLVDEAPELLKKAFPPGEALSDGIQFEYRSVKLERTWFEPKLFSSRLWRFPAGSGQGALAYAGHNGSAGRFPAYIAALVLVRNLRTERGERMLEEGNVMSMAYICKWLPACPDPDPAAHWGSEIKTAQLHINPVAGGKVAAKSNNEDIASGPRPIGDVITFWAYPDETHILDHWRVGDTDIPAGDSKLQLTMTEAGLTVTPVWGVAQKSDGMQVCVKGKTLVSISGGPNVLDMNAYKSICDVDTIAEDAFSMYDNLRQIVIGVHVASIGRHAFRGCKKLENVTLPAATRSIDPNAFRSDNHQEDPIFKVDPDNDIYTAVDGLLVEKRRTATMHTVRCRCGVSYFYNGQQRATCPNCGATLDANNASDCVIHRPDAVIPMKLVADEATEKVRTFLKNKWFADPAFRQAVADTDLAFQKVHVPHWEWTIQCNGKFEIEIKKAVTTKGDDGKTKTDTVTETQTAEVSIPEDACLVSASKIVPEKSIDSANRVKETFTPNDGDLFELYPYSSKESLAKARERMDEKLKNKALGTIKNAIGMTVKSQDIEYVSERSTLMALPFWVGAINYKEKRYTFLVDGYTGAVTARNGYPKNKKKIWRTVGICAGIVAVIVLLIVIFS